MGDNRYNSTGLSLQDRGLLVKALDPADPASVRYLLER